jgi:hypothetical protein
MKQQPGLEQFEPATDLDLDLGIRNAVLVLRSAGIETFESCQGGEGARLPGPYNQISRGRLGGLPRVCGSDGTRLAGAANAAGARAVVGISFPHHDPTGCLA